MKNGFYALGAMAILLNGCGAPSADHCAANVIVQHNQTYVRDFDETGVVEPSEGEFAEIKTQSSVHSEDLYTAYTIGETRFDRDPEFRVRLAADTFDFKALLLRPEHADDKVRKIELKGFVRVGSEVDLLASRYEIERQDWVDHIQSDLKQDDRVTEVCGVRLEKSSALIDPVSRTVTYEMRIIASYIDKDAAELARRLARD